MFNNNHKIFDNKGYLDSNRGNFSPFKVINSDNITMKGVSQELLAIPFKNGIPQNIVNMYPENNYKFNADFVVELPKFQDGNTFNNPFIPNSARNPLDLNNPLGLNNIADGRGLFSQQRQRQIDNVQLITPEQFGIRKPETFTPGTFGENRLFDPTPEEFGIRRPQTFPPDFSQTGQQITGGTEGLTPSAEEQARVNQISQGNLDAQNNNQNFNFQDPFLGADIGLNTSLFKAGQSFGFNTEGLGLSPEAQRRARTGNIFRGVGAVGKSVLNIGRLVGAGFGHQNRLQEALAESNENQRQVIANSYRFENGGLLQFLQNGGVVSALSPEKALTGEFITGLPDHAEEKANAELEVNEYIKHPNDDVQQVVGKTHEKGGEKVELESGTIVISDNLKLGGEGAKQCNKQYDMKLKASDTYADAVAKFTAKIGLKKLNEEQEALFVRLKKEDDTQDETTSNLNKEFLSGRIKEIEDEKKALDIKRIEFVDYVFAKQQGAKGDTDEILKYENGGIIKDKRFIELRKKHNLSEEQAMEIYNTFVKGEVKKLQDGGNFSFASLNPNTQSIFNKQSANVDNPNAFGNIDVNKSVSTYERLFPELLNKHFIKNEQGVYEPREGDDTIRKFQTDYNEFVADSSNYLIELGANQKEVNDYVNNIRFLSDNPNAVRGIDNKLGQFTTTRSGFKRDVVTQEQLQKLNKEGIYTGRQALRNKAKAIKLLGQEGYDNVVKGLDKHTSADFTIGQVQGAQVTPVAQPTSTEQTPITPLNIEQRNRSVTGLPFLPDQSVTPPGGVQPHALINRFYQRLDPVEITNEENLKEIFRSQNFMANQLDQLPDSQRRAALANTLATTQENINRSTVQTNIANARNRQATEQFNIGQTNREEDARAGDLLNFERRQLTALAKTQADIDNYFDFNRRVRLGNFNTLSKINTLNNLYENFNVGTFGEVQFDPTQSVQFTAPKQI